MKKSTRMMLRVAYTLLMGLVAVGHFVEAAADKSADDFAIGFWMTMQTVVFWLFWIASDHLKESCDVLMRVWMHVHDVDADDEEQVREAEERIRERFNKEGL